jgi:uncharacterized protein YbjT (DUF2867 family)
MITVMGATGHTGKKITEALLEAGEKARALGRSKSKLAELKSSGAEVLTGDVTDATFLTKAFRGADAVYTFLPTDRRSPDYRAEQDREGEAIAKAIRDSGVRYVVALSSLGADLSEGTGVIAGLHAQEGRLKRLEGVNILLLRPVSFFENFYETLGLIKHEGINGDSVAPDLSSRWSRRRRSKPETGKASLSASHSARATSAISRRRAYSASASASPISGTSSFRTPMRPRRSCRRACRRVSPASTSK